MTKGVKMFRLLFIISLLLGSFSTNVEANSGPSFNMNERQVRRYIRNNPSDTNRIDEAKVLGWMNEQRGFLTRPQLKAIYDVFVNGRRGNDVTEENALESIIRLGFSMSMGDALAIEAMMLFATNNGVDEGSMIQKIVKDYPGNPRTNARAIRVIMRFGRKNNDVNEKNAILAILRSGYEFYPEQVQRIRRIMRNASDNNGIDDQAAIMAVINGY